MGLQMVVQGSHSGTWALDQGSGKALQMHPLPVNGTSQLAQTNNEHKGKGQGGDG